MNALQKLRQKYLDDGCPNFVDVIDQAIAVTDGEYNDVVLAAYHIGPDFANELNACVIELIAND